MRPVIGLTTSLAQHSAESKAERFAINTHYVRAVAAAGGAPLLIPGLGDVAALDAVLPLLDGLLLTGGPDVHPERFGQAIDGTEEIDEARDATELALLGYARQTALPVLGICRGVQILNVGFGGTLVQDIPSQRPGTPLNHRGSVPEPPRTVHALSVTAGSRLASYLGTETIPANSLHHQALDVVAPGFVVSARSEDGIVEAIEYQGQQFAVGVQCHPEWLYQDDARWLGLFRALVTAARQLRKARR